MYAGARKIILVFSLFLCAFFLNAQAGPIYGSETGHFPPPPPPKDSENIMKYRGNRTYTENLPLKLVQARCVLQEGDLACIALFFNQSINPRSVHPTSILINNTPLPAFVRFQFNKKGDSLKVFMPVKMQSFKLKVCNISAFDGTGIEPVELLLEVERL